MKGGGCGYVTAASKSVQREINEEASRGAHHFAMFLESSNNFMFRGWTAYNTAAALHKLRMFSRSRNRLPSELVKVSRPVCDLALRFGPDLDARGLANVALDLGMMREWQVLVGMIPIVIRRLTENFSMFSGWDLTNILYGYHFPDLHGNESVRQVFQAIGGELSQVEWDQWKGKDLANTLYAYGVVRKVDTSVLRADDVKPFLRRAWKATCNAAPHMQVEEFVNVLWGISQFEVTDGSFKDVPTVCLKILQAHRQHFTAELLSRCVACVACLCRRHDVLDPRARSRISSQRSANEAEKTERDLFNEIARLAMELQWPKERRSRFIWAFACLRMKHSSVFAHVLGTRVGGAYEDQQQWCSYEDVDIATIVWAMAIVQANEPQTKAWMMQVMRFLGTESRPKMCLKAWLNVLWAAAVCDVSLPDALRDHLLIVFRGKDIGDLNGVSLPLWSDVDKRMFDQVARFHGLEGVLFNVCCAQGVPTPSFFQKQVSDVLSAMGINFVEELDGMDIVIPSQHIAIEVDGPAHYVVDLERDGALVEIGRNVFRRRLAAAKGLRLVVVPYWEWGECSQTGYQEYLSGKIDIARAQPDASHVNRETDHSQRQVKEVPTVHEAWTGAELALEVDRRLVDFHHFPTRKDRVRILTSVFSDAGFDGAKLLSCRTQHPIACLEGTIRNTLDPVVKNTKALSKVVYESVLQELEVMVVAS
eukprot:TRINITY_DN30927_c0_g1_i1.p1 TRINITY_DN30927_c0_g1~~TRINITY_DN30927_c0_g1_i1.p1  ORF type:complete len:705 (-),score=60.74 TRINITY_DN30927_c0_g1_i1:150-2264(-)